MQFSNELLALDLSETEVEILTFVYSHHANIQTLHLSDRVSLSETSISVKAMELLGYLRGRRLDPVINNMCYYFLEDLPAHLITSVYDLWLQTKGTVDWQSDGF